MHQRIKTTRFWILLYDPLLLLSTLANKMFVITATRELMRHGRVHPSTIGMARMQVDLCFQTETSVGDALPLQFVQDQAVFLMFVVRKKQAELATKFVLFECTMNEQLHSPGA